MSSNSSLHTATAEDSVWVSIRETANEQVQKEPILASFLHTIILNHDCLEDAVSFHLAERLHSSTLSEMPLREIVDHALSQDTQIGKSIRADITAVKERDPAVCSYLVPLLYMKGLESPIGFGRKIVGF